MANDPRVLAGRLHHTIMGVDMGAGPSKTAIGVFRRPGWQHLGTFDTVEEAHAEIERIRRGAVDLELQPDGSYAPAKRAK